MWKKIYTKLLSEETLNYAIVFLAGGIFIMIALMLFSCGTPSLQNLVEFDEPVTEDTVIYPTKPIDDSATLPPPLVGEVTVEPLYYDSEVPVIEDVQPYVLSDEEMLAYIIERESGGDPYAENGIYKGIGQLSENKYPIYIGATWEEVRGDYDAQKQAMLNYITDRYGAILVAYDHWIVNGWY